MKIIIGLEMMIRVDNKAGCYAVLAQNFGEGDIGIAKGLPLCRGKDAFTRMINPSAGDCGQSLGGGIREQCPFVLRAGQDEVF